MGAKQTNKFFDTFKDVWKSFGSNLTPLRFLTTSSAKRVLFLILQVLTQNFFVKYCNSLFSNDSIRINDKSPFQNCFIQSKPPQGPGLLIQSGPGQVHHVIQEITNLEQSWQLKCPNLRNSELLLTRLGIISCSSQLWYLKPLRMNHPGTGTRASWWCASRTVRRTTIRRSLSIERNFRVQMDKILRSHSFQAKVRLLYCINK